MSKPAPVVALDLGGTRLRVALVDSAGRILDRVVEDTRSEEGPERVVQRVVDLSARLLSRLGFGGPLGLGAAVAGPLDRDGVIYDPPNLIGWRNVPFRAMLQERFDAPVRLGNDANLACLGEHVFGAARGINDVIYMTVSTGVGGGVISEGVLIAGWRGMGAEVGHIIIDPNGPRGRCGHVGCLESHVSGTAIASRARAALMAGQKSALVDRVEGVLERVRAEDVFAAAAAGDAFSKDLVRHVATEMAVGIVSLIHIFNPRMFLLGGGVVHNWGMLAEDVQREIRERTFRGFLEGFELGLAGLGDDAGLAGAAALVLREAAPRG